VVLNVKERDRQTIKQGPQDVSLRPGGPIRDQQKNPDENPNFCQQSKGISATFDLIHLSPQIADLGVSSSFSKPWICDATPGPLGPLGFE
jgi:hypothetical protein